MNTRNTILAAALGLGLASTASADTICITGSSAFRSQVHNAIRALLSSETVAYNGLSTDGLNKATYSIFKGTFGGNPITVKCTWTGSVAGIHTTSESVPVTFLSSNEADVPTTNGDNATNGTAGANINTNPASAVPDIGFSDVFQGSTNYNTNPLDDERVSVLPFVFIAGEGGSAAGITNMTPQLAQALFTNGKLPLALWSGNTADRTTAVYALGRNDESGTRLTAMAETGVGALSGIVQYQPNETSAGSGVVGSYTNIGNGGYSSGGDLAKALGLTASAGTGFNVSYVGISDSATAVAAGATILPYNGVAQSTQAIIDGKYTFWCYEHLFTRSDLTGQAAALKASLVTNLTGLATSSSAIKITDMKVSRITDGSQVGNDYPTP